MPASAIRYPTLRRTRTVVRVFSPIISASALIIGLSLFASVAPRLINPGYSISERMIWGVIGLGYLIGVPLVGMVLYFLLRAAADLIDLWFASEEAAERTAYLMERQLVPGIERMCQLLEKLPDRLGSSATQLATNAEPSRDFQGRQQAIDSVRDAVRHEWWDQARRLATAFAEQFPDATEAKTLKDQIDAAFTRKVKLLQTQLDEAQHERNAEALMNARDRLSAYVAGEELDQLDRRVAGWITGYIRDALADGRANDVLPLAERVVDTLGDTRDGAQVRAALPTLRRSAGLCPDCGQPYDVSLVRCDSCESKRARRKSAAAPKPTQAP